MAIFRYLGPSRDVFLSIVCVFCCVLITSGELSPSSDGSPQSNLPQLPSELMGSKKMPESRRVKAKSTVVKLIEEEACKEDIRRICKDPRNNFAVLECLQNEKRDLQDIVSDKCNHLLWNYKLNMTRGGRIEELAKGVCEAELRQLDCAKDTQVGNVIFCILSNLNHTQDERCHQYLVRLAAIVFSDIRLVEDMVNSCRPEIETLECGRVDMPRPGEPHSQGSTIECLTKHIARLGASCQKQIFRLSELQSGDFHLDRALFFACREDREKFCETIRAGEGRVYKCLMKHKTDRGMSRECVDQLSRRQQLTVQDYRVNKGIVRSCKNVISKYNCRKGSSDDRHDVKLSRILLCLEKALREGANIDGSCKGEMLAHRRQLMEDYKLSPDLVMACSEELKLCSGGIETGGRTLHCLMKNARSHNPRKHVSDQCKRELQKVVKDTDAGEDWRVDPVLHEACHPMVESTCKDIRGGNARVMRCLMRHLDSPEMPQECEAALLEIQYFVSRDWKLDPVLYSACANESERLCNARRDWTDASPNTNTQKRNDEVLPCLFRYIYHPKTNLRLSSKCKQEVQRVMHERAAHVDLHPEIEMVCMDHLATLCSENTGPGEEIECLQNNFERLNKDCKDVISNYTEAEARDAELNPQINVLCASAIQLMCKGEFLTGSDDGTLMECLVRHKNSNPMRSNYPKCRAAIEHFQLLSLKDYTFTPRFKEACQKDVGKLCKKPKNKADVVDCLSTNVRNAIINNDNHQVSKACRQQLRLQLTQRHENIRLDPKLHEACAEDTNKFCKDKSPGRGEILECLRTHKQSLSVRCHQLMFVREQEQHQDPGTDVVLMMACKQMINQYCSDNIDSEKLLTCLKAKKKEPDFDRNCRNIIVRRLIEQTTDTRLNPALLKSCRRDMAKFCSSLFVNQTKASTELNGLLTQCLKEQLPAHMLTSDCEKHVMSLARSAALSYKMDPILVENCKNDMNVLCFEYVGDDHDGHMEECLKLNFDNNKLESEECRLHIAHIIRTQRADIHVDPILNEACGIDDSKYCENKERGGHLACLLDVLERNPNGLKLECREKLRQRREMYNAAMKVMNIRELVDHVVKSPERTYVLLILITIIGMIFVGGLFCGRATKRYRLLKDR